MLTFPSRSLPFHLNPNTPTEDEVLTRALSAASFSEPIAKCATELLRHIIQIASTLPDSLRNPLPG